MKRNRIVLRADASKNTGYGHFVRSLALADHLKNEFNCIFASYNEDEPCGTASDNQLDQINKVCNSLELAGRKIEEANSMFLNEILPQDIVVLDNYYFTPDYQKELKAKGCKLVCIDDIPKKQFVCDVLITGSPLNRSDFILPSSALFKSGIEWFFLRDAFLQSSRVRTNRSQIQNVVMAMGGSDAFNLTDKMICIVRKILPQAKIDVIAGATVDVKKQGLNEIAIHRNLSAEEIVGLYDRSDIGIFPASTVAVEALSRNLTVFAGHYVNNQRVLYDFGVNKGYFSPLGNLLDSEHLIEDRLKRALNCNFPLPQLTCFLNQRQQTLDLFRKL